MYMHARMHHARTHAHTHSHTHVHTHTHIHARTHTNICMHKHTYTRLQSPMRRDSSSEENTSLLPTTVSSLSALIAPTDDSEDFTEVGSLPAADDTTKCYCKCHAS